jgi:hypothetical protein
MLAEIVVLSGDISRRWHRRRFDELHPVTAICDGRITYEAWPRSFGCDDLPSDLGTAPMILP